MNTKSVDYIISDWLIKQKVKTLINGIIILKIKTIAYYRRIHEMNNWTLHNFQIMRKACADFHS